MDQGARIARRPGEGTGPAVERAPGVVRVRSFAAARQLLRARGATTQAGFTAEHIPKGLFRNHPILLSDGPGHDEQRASVARFFAPAVITERYGRLLGESADRLLGQAVADGGCELDRVTLHYTVEVTAEIVGLTESPVEALSVRLEAFFRQPPMDITKPGLGRSRRDWMIAARNGIVPVVQFWWRDVRPAVRARRAEPSQDVISHLIANGHSMADIAVECITYGTAGMVTTREFICMAAWHLLQDPELGASYRTADQRARLAILMEIIRLEPVVGHLYRRVRETLTLSDGGAAVELAPGDLVDIAVRDVNTDPTAVGEDPMEIRPGRKMPRAGDGPGMAFGDGAHRCPGRDLALLEADAFLGRLLALEPRVIAEPTIEWDDVIEGYALRGLRLEFPG